jgi:hypothetical protein
VRALVLILFVACGGPQAKAPGSSEGSNPTSTSTPTSNPTSTSTPTPTPTSTSTPAVASTGGAVIIGTIAAGKHFDPKPTLDDLRPDMLTCFRQARASNPALRGKVTLRIQVNEAGAVLNVEGEPGGPANDPALVACIRDDFRGNAHFPKPGGSATIEAPLVFHP